MGAFMVELYWDHAPRTCRNFAELANRGYYNDVVFHRIVPDFVIQGGDPSGTGMMSEPLVCAVHTTAGRGGTSIYGDTFADELHPDLKHTGAGILSMANAGPNTNASQFFITLAPTQHLDGRHSIFGRICAGA
jgi:peptidyl-prolyl cis-trans isomerase-like 1